MIIGKRIISGYAVVLELLSVVAESMSEAAQAETAAHSLHELGHGLGSMIGSKA